ncbi:MAG: copper chaperone PCu(A)C [Pararhodobacter sp.]|nr:copper chaperone PCu(A)C [Pararhodobacter sp.]
MIRKAFTAPLALAAALVTLPALACDGFEIHDGYARASHAMAQSGAAFMVIHNHGTEDCHITGARSDVAQRVELHTHIEDDQGVMRMGEIEGGFQLPVDGEIILARGGDHVMFLGLTRPLAQGDLVEVTFVFADGTEATVEVPVDNERQPADHGHSHGHSHSHSHSHSGGHSHSHD